MSDFEAPDPLDPKVTDNDDEVASKDLEAIREGLAQSVAGKGRRASEFFAEFERKHGLESHES